MTYRRVVGSSDLDVSEISLGSWLTFSGGVAFDQVRACTDAAFDAGINFFDTANVYGRGAAETAWGEILSGRPRDSYILATKVGADVGRPGRSRPLAGADRQADRGLACAPADRLRRPLPGAPLRPRRPDRGDDRRLPAGRDRRQGALPRFQRVDARADPGRDRFAGPGLFVSSQPQYSMLWQAPEAEVFPLCAANGISQIVWSPLAQGLLTGKYRPASRHRRLARGARRDERRDGLVMSDGPPRGGRSAAARRRAGGPFADRARARLGAAPPRARLGDRRRFRGPSRSTPTRASGIELTADTLAAIDAALWRRAGQRSRRPGTVRPRLQAISA